MEARSIDHVNLRIPEDGQPAAVEFYGDRLGFGIEGVARWRAGEKSFFDVRLAPEHVVHLWPTPAFDPPTGTNYDHLAVVVEDPFGYVVELKTAVD